MNWKNSNLRIWVFRALVLAACVVMLVSFIMPWWIGRFTSGEEVQIYGWGLRHTLVSFASYLDNDVTPLWQVVLAWTYVGVSIVLVLSSTCIKKWWGQTLQGFVGLGVVSYAFIALNVVVTNRLMDLSLPVQGIGIIGSDLATIVVNSTIQQGYYLAYIAGGLMILLALLRSVIVGKQK